MDPAYIKGYAVCGEALVEIGKSEVGSYSKLDQGVKALQKAFALCMGQNLRGFEQTIEDQILKALKIKFYKQREVESDEKASMLNELRLKMQSYQEMMVE